MKYLFFTLLSAALFACTISDKKETPKEKADREQKGAEAVKDSANYTTLQWLDSTNQDLGNLKEGDVVELSWRFKNTGTKPLVVADIRVGCGCTVPERPSAPIAPGEEGVIKAKFNTEGKSGHQNKDVYVDANNSNRNNTTDNKLTFTADIKE